MKTLINIALLLGLLILNSCEIAKRPQLLQSNVLLSEQNLRKNIDYKAEKEKPILGQVQIHNQADFHTIMNHLVVSTIHRNLAAKLKKDNTPVFVSTIVNVKNLGFALLKPRSSLLTYSSKIQTESRVFFTLALIFLILALVLIIFIFLAANVLSFGWGAFLFFISLSSLALSLLLFILGLIFH